MTTAAVSDHERILEANIGAMNMTASPKSIQPPSAGL
jgi:hypothetical protein